ncbi:hypothetical protein [Adlercreutzia equolifaciens]|uniref:hypothetical protein n=1 Tax=Adlercreutzia equolifaciens TaxID=446660 RepID=UPI00242DB2D0|nr:hypothetical protein [Adlercreutzia equolifaciens]
MEYTLKSGRVITDAEIEAMAEAAESGALPGQWSGGVVVGRPLSASSQPVLDSSPFKAGRKRRTVRRGQTPRPRVRWLM